MIFPIMKKIGYFLGGLLGMFMAAASMGIMLSCKYDILSWKACGCIIFVLLGIFVAIGGFVEFKEYDLKRNEKCSRKVFWDEMKEILKTIVGYPIFAFLAVCFMCFVATIIWTITSFPEFLLHFIHYGPSTDLYNIIIPESFRATKPIEAIYSLMMAGVFAILCFFGAIFLIHRFLIKELYEFISEELDKINCKIDNVMKEVSKINKEGMQ